MLRPMRPNPLMPTLDRHPSFLRGRKAPVDQCADRVRRYTHRPWRLVLRRLTGGNTRDRARVHASTDVSVAILRVDVPRLQPAAVLAVRRRRRRGSSIRRFATSKYIGSLRAAARLSADLVQHRRRGIDLDPCGVGRRGADGARRSSTELQGPLPAACGCSCRPRRSPGSRWRGAAAATSTASSISRSTGPSSSGATLDIVRPRLFVMMETEIWPNLLRACRRARA